MALAWNPLSEPVEISLFSHYVLLCGSFSLFYFRFLFGDPFLSFMSSFMYLNMIEISNGFIPLMTFIGFLLSVSSFIYLESTVTGRRFSTLLIFIGFLPSVYSFMCEDGEYMHVPSKTEDIRSSRS